MAGRIAEDKIQEIRERTDIVEVVSSYLPLKRAGANFLGLCPFHSEKTPSFNVHVPKQIFHCFGCGAGGDVIAFVMRMEGLSFPEVARRLGGRVGIEIAEEVLSPAEDERRRERERLIGVGEVAGDFYHQLLLDSEEGAPARRYLRRRGYGGETVRTFRLGFAPPRWEALREHLQAKGIDLQLALQLGLLRTGKHDRGDYDLFRNRLLFPIHDTFGQVVAFGGRVLDDSLPKYINSPESQLYHKGRMLYGLYQAREEARKTGVIIVVEGYFDLLALHRAGFRNVVATCGTALTEEHARLLKRYAARVLLLFDQDRAGQQAAFRALDGLHAEGLATAMVALDPGEDPDSFLQRHGDEIFRQRLETARPSIEVFTDAALAAHGTTIEGRARAVEEVLARLRPLSSAIERSLYLQALAKRVGLDEELLRQKLQPEGAPPVAAAKGVAVTPPRPAPAPPPPPRKRQGGTEMKAQQWLLCLMIADHQIRQRVAADGVALFLPEGEFQELAVQVLKIAGAEEDLDPESLRAQLSPEHQALLAGLLERDRASFAENPEQLFEDCRRAVARRQLKLHSLALQEKIRQVEQAQDWERHADLLRELMKVNRDLAEKRSKI